MEERCGPWRLERLIAVGGIGEVWQGRAGEQVAAIKRLHTHLLRHAEVRALFETERTLLGALPPHPALVAGRGAGAQAGRPWVAMQYVDGPDLRQLCEGGAAARGQVPALRALPVATALEVAAAAARAAGHLHTHGWVHGDVVPANLLVERTLPAVVLCDLGMARRIGAGGPVQGTHAYMAPEQVRGERWTAATDVFALGVVLWELLAGKRLFHRGPPWLSMQAVMEGDVPSLGDAALDELVGLALQRDPHGRVADGNELARALTAS